MKGREDLFMGMYRKEVREGQERKNTIDNKGSGGIRIEGSGTEGEEDKGEERGKKR